MGNKAMKIEDICKVSSSKRIFAREYVETGVPFWRGKEVTEHATGKNDSKGLFISAKRYNELKQTGNVPSDDDVLITAVGTIGSIYQIKHEDLPFYFKDGNIIRLSNWNTDRVNPTYVSLFLRSQIGQQAIKEVEIGSTQKALTIKDIAKVPILLPELKTQNDIVAAIGVIDAKIKINQQINKNLLRLAKQQFNLTFPNVHEGNSRLSNVMENFDRKRIPLARREREKRQGVYRYVGATSVLDYVDDYLFDGTYLLMGEDGTVQDEKGFPILQYIWGKFWPNNHTHVLSGTFVSTEWLYLFLMNTNVRSRITGAVQQKISQANMNSIPLTIPSKDELFRFQKQIEPVFSQIQLLDEQNLKLTAIHKLLLPKLLAGQIDLSNLEGAIQNA